MAGLTRPKYLMTGFISEALLHRGLMEIYHSRPANQQNDYIGWNTRARV
jgi:hypothetical protein